jgi:hypothetical protein
MASAHERKCSGLYGIAKTLCQGRTICTVNHAFLPKVGPQISPQIVNPQMCDKPATFYMNQTETAALYTRQQNQEQLTVMHKAHNKTSDLLHGPTEQEHLTCMHITELQRPFTCTKQNQEHLTYMHLTELVTFYKHETENAIVYINVADPGCLSWILDPVL